MDPVKRIVTQEGEQVFQKTNIPAEASLVLVLQYKLGCRLLERPGGPDAVDLRLPNLLHQSGQESLGLFELSCSSALANSPPADVLVDVPEAIPEGEARCLFTPHFSTPFGRAGRPLHLT